jgi:transcriptional regulator
VYQPSHHREDRLEVQHALIQTYPLGALVTLGEEGLVANHIPFILDAGAGALGTLRGHLARANGQWRDVRREGEALVIFQGPQRYITPSWYATKQETGKVVPTWNYAVVHAYGVLRAIEDSDRLKDQIERLTALQEGVRDEPWAVSDAPGGFIEAMMKAIVGIEIEITRLEGKWKVSQNLRAADRRGVAEGLRAGRVQGSEESGAMAQLVEEFSPKS